MRIGIDISQTAYENAGVGNYLANLVANMLLEDNKNDYILFFSSLRRRPSNRVIKALRKNPRAQLKMFKIPPTILNIMWNQLHIVPIETFIGKVDFFISSDWAEPPSRAKKGTIIYDLIVYKYPEETHNETEVRFGTFNISPNIVSVQKRKLDWVKKESDVIFAISESTRNDAVDILDLDPKKIKVLYPGL